MEESENVCKMCLKVSSKYTCPRCNMGYCCVDCYQSEKHAGCSEAFYKECVVNELSEMSSNPEDKQRVLDMLAKDLEEKADDDTGDSSDDDLAERLDGLDLDKDISRVWSRLKPKEKEEFARMLQDGRLANLIELWTPWWRHSKNHKLVLEEEAAEDAKMPDVLTNISDINILLKNNKPSAECKFDLLNILFSYAFVARLHNGGHLECPMDAAQDVLDSCFVLRDQNRCGSVGEAVQKSQDDTSKRMQESENFTSAAQFNLNVLGDVCTIVTGPGKSGSLVFISTALSDLLTLLTAALKVIKKELKERRTSGEDGTELAVLKTSMFKAEKKVSFLLSWTQRYGVAAQQLLPQLRFEIETRQAEVEQVDEMKSVIASNMDKLKPQTDLVDSGRSKIEELN